MTGGAPPGTGCSRRPPTAPEEDLLSLVYFYEADHDAVIESLPSPIGDHQLSARGLGRLPPSEIGGDLRWLISTTEPTGAVAGEPVREGELRRQGGAVEPGGVEFIPASDRHGTPLQLLWTWTSPNLEFATIFVGILGVGIFGLSFWQAVLALLIGNVLGSLSQACCRRVGRSTVCRRWCLSRTAFGFWGNVLPAGLELDHRRHRLVRGEQRQRRVRARRR